MKALCQARDIRLEVLGSRHLRVANTYELMGDVLIKQNQHRKAHVKYERALSIFSEHHGEEHKSVVRLRKAIAEGT